MKGGVHRFLSLAVLLIMLSLGGIQPVNAQTAADTEETLAPQEVSEPPEEALSPEQQVLDMDIRTSAFSELAAWCRSLGLSEGGTKEELANRLRTYYKISPPNKTPETGEKQRIITIESARSTEYFTLDVVDEEYARLQGGVVINLKDGEAIHRIKAGEILYNRTRNLMTASRGVEYVKEEGDTIETFKGESITVNLDNWSSIFMGGITERSLNKAETAYRFSGTVISRSDEEVTVMTDATISNAKNEEAYWSLHAYKLWLLPGSDWAVLSAVLKVGEIPVFYIPFFYYPADEIIFHPVVGHRSREGNFVQTTTYLLGRPRATAASENSFSKILGSGEGMEKVREGIFLRSTGKKSRDPNDTRLSILFDAYSHLGFYLGTELTLPQKGILGAIELSAGIGFTRDVYRLNAGYTPFAQYDGSDEWNGSRLFSLDVPFRYRFHTKGSLGDSKSGSLTWTFPFYSDPYVNRDFLNRSEEMDWVQMFKGETEEQDLTKNILGSYDWRLNGSLPLTPLVSNLAPYISSLTISNISSSLAFNTRTSSRITNGVSPNRTFFYPDKLTIYSVTASMSGTLLTLGAAQAAQTFKPEEPRDNLFQGIGNPRSPWEPLEESKNDQKRSADSNQLKPPVLSQGFDFPKAGGPRFTIDYQLSPASASELKFRSSQQHWPEVEDINWGETSSILTNFRGSGNISFSLTQPETHLYSTSLRFSGNGQWEGYTYINEEAEEYTTSGITDQDKIDKARLDKYKATFFATTYDYSATLKPLYQSAIWGNSTLQYTLGGRLIRSEFDGTAQDPSWAIKYGEWIKEDITTHQMSMNLAASIRDQIQNVSITTELPPRDTTLGEDATFRAWITETNIRNKILNPWDPEERKVDPVYFTETIKFGTTYPFQFKQQVVYSPEFEGFTNLTSSLSWIGLTLSFVATRSKTYTLESTGWIQSTDPEELNPREFRLEYTKTLKKDSLWGKRLSFSFNVNSVLILDLQRYTNSQLNFNLNFNLKVTNFLELSLGASSENKVVFRYFQSLPFFNLPRELPGEQNFFVDLFNSFRFDNETLRRSSGFKLKTFSLAMVHHLGDWNATLKVTLSPYLDQNIRPFQYKFNNEISFLVQWIPMSEIKVDIRHNKDATVIK